MQRFLQIGTNAAILQIGTNAAILQIGTNAANVLEMALKHATE